MEALLQSFILVLASEIGDKTMLLALILALRFKKPAPIMAGILVATVVNHGLATLVGGWAADLLPENILRIVLAMTFFAFAIWILVPDKVEDEPAKLESRQSVFWTTTVLFFLAEMGDKTQLATVALGAKFQMPLAITTGTTLGMLVADGLAVFLGERATRVVPLAVVRAISSLLFVIFGLSILFGWG